MSIYLFTESKSIGLVSDVNGKLTSGILFLLKSVEHIYQKYTLSQKFCQTLECNALKNVSRSF